MYWCKQLTHLTTYVIWIAFWIPKEHVHPISEMRVERQALQQNLMVKGMNKKTGIARACQSIWKDGRDLRHERASAPSSKLLSRFKGLSLFYTSRVTMTLWSWWDRSDRIAVTLIFPIFHTYWMAISFSSCLLFLTLGSPLIRFIYHGPKFTTPGSHYRINTRSKADGKMTSTQVWWSMFSHSGLNFDQVLVWYLYCIVIA